MSISEFGKYTMIIQGVTMGELSEEYMGNLRAIFASVSLNLKLCLHIKFI